jgi:hypothetical protein
MVADLFDRALPWGRLLRLGHPLPGGLNFTATDRVASALVGAAGLALVLSPFTPGRHLPAAALALLGLALLLDAPFLGFAARRGSLAFAAAAALLQLLHRGLGLLGLGLGLLSPPPRRQA